MIIPIFRIPSRLTGYDWTYAVGANVYDIHDWQSVQLLMMDKNATSAWKKNDEIKFDTSMNNNNNSEYTTDESSDSDEDSDLEPAPHIKASPSQLQTQVLVTCNEYEFLYTVSPTPGLGENHDTLIPVLGYVVNNVFKYSIERKTVHVLRSDGMLKNKNVPKYTLEFLIEMNNTPLLRSNMDYHYNLRTWIFEYHILVCFIFIENLSKVVKIVLFLSKLTTI